MFTTLHNPGNSDSFLSFKNPSLDMINKHNILGNPFRHDEGDKFIGVNKPPSIFDEFIGINKPPSIFDKFNNTDKPPFNDSLNRKHPITTGSDPYIICEDPQKHIHKPLIDISNPSNPSDTTKQISFRDTMHNHNSSTFNPNDYVMKTGSLKDQIKFFNGAMTGNLDTNFENPNLQNVSHPNINHHNDIKNNDVEFKSVLAGFSYSLANGDGNTSRERLHNAINDAIHDNPCHAQKLKHLEIITPKDNIDFAVLKDKATGTIYEINRGTDLTHGQSTRLRDLYNDFQIAVGVTPHRVQTIQRMHDEVRQAYPNSKIELIGHSLGGTIAQEIAKSDHNTHATVFNPAQIHVSNHGQTYNNIHEHSISGDPITTGDSIGSQVDIYHMNNDYGLGNHSLDHFSSNACPSTMLDVGL